MRAKQLVSTLVLICFGPPLLGYITKTNFIPFETIDPEISSALIIYKSV